MQYIKRRFECAACVAHFLFTQLRFILFLHKNAAKKPTRHGERKAKGKFMLVNIKELREQYGLSQQELADIVGVSQQSLSKYERLETEPDCKTLVAFADYFGTTVDYIIGHEVKPSARRNAEDKISKREREFIEQFRKLPRRDKKKIETAMGIYLAK